MRRIAAPAAREDEAAEGKTWVGVERDLHTLAGLTSEPVTAADVAAALGVDDAEVLSAGSSLAAQGAIREEGPGWVAITRSEASGPERANLAGRLAAVVGDSRPGTAGRLLAEAGRTDEAVPLLVAAAASGDAEAASLALEVGPPTDPVETGRLHLALAAHHRGRGESATALDHARRAIPLLDPTTAIDALGFTALIHDDLQQSHEAGTWATVAAGAAANRGEFAKEGSILTLAARSLSRLGFADEAEATARKGQALVEAHGTPTQRARARTNAAWVDLDHGDADDAAAAFASVADLAGYVGGDLEEAARLASHARALFHMGHSARAIPEYERAIAMAGDAAAPRFLAHLAFAEGATMHGIGEAAVDAADQVLAIVGTEMPAWRNVGHLTAARAHRVAGNPEVAAEHLEKAVELTPDGIDGIRIRLRCEVERLHQLPAGARWPKTDAARLTDALLQASWYSYAAELMGLRAYHEKGTDWGAQAIALAGRLGSPLLAANAAEAAAAWGKPEGALAARLVRDADPHVADVWREAWDDNPVIASAAAVTADVDAEAVDAQLEDALVRAGLVGEAVSPAQRAAEGLEFQGRRTARGWLAPILSWAAALVTIGVVAALLFWPDYRIIDPPERVAGTHLPRGGPTNQGITAEGGITEPDGLYWEPIEDLGQGVSAPIAASVGLVVADLTTGRLSGFDQKTGRTIWTHDAGESIRYRPTIANGVDGGGSGRPMVVWATQSGTVAARPFLGGNQSEVWTVDLGGNPLTAPVSAPSDDPKTSVIYVAARRESGPVLVAIDGASGATWERPLDAEPVGELAVTETGVLFTDEDDRLTVLDTRTRELHLSCDVPAPAVDDQAPLVAGDFVAVPFPGREMGLFMTSSCQAGYDWGNGRLTQPQIDMDLTRRPAVIDGTFVYISQGALNRYDPSIWDPDRHVLRLEDLQTQEQREQAAEIQSELFPWDQPFLPDEGERFTTDPIVAGGTVLVGTDGGVVIAVDLETGTEQWRYDLDGPVVGEIAVVDGALFVTTQRGILFAIGGPAAEPGDTPPIAEPFPEGRAPDPVEDDGESADTDGSTEGSTSTTAPAGGGDDVDGEEDEGDDLPEAPPPGVVGPG